MHSEGLYQLGNTEHNFTEDQPGLKMSLEKLKGIIQTLSWLSPLAPSESWQWELAKGQVFLELPACHC